MERPAILRSIEGEMNADGASMQHVCMIPYLVMGVYSLVLANSSEISEERCFTTRQEQSALAVGGSS